MLGSSQKTFYSFHNYPVRYPITHILQVSKLRLREVEYYDQAHTAGKWKSQDLSHDLSYSKALLFSNILYSSLKFKKEISEGKEDSIYHYPGTSAVNMSL